MIVYRYRNERKHGSTESGLEDVKACLHQLISSLSLTHNSNARLVNRVVRLHSEMLMLVCCLVSLSSLRITLENKTLEKNVYQSLPLLGVRRASCRYYAVLASL
jgi:hypothetical protein